MPRFTPKERVLVERLRTPLQVQGWLNRLPYNWERKGPTARTFRGVVAHGTAHCFEAALGAACILEQQGFPPLLLDIESVDGLDHVLFLHQAPDGRWGTVARSRCVGLHGRKPVFRTLDALVASYVAPFIDQTGRVKGYGVLDLRGLPTGAWRLGRGNVPHVEQALRDLRHKRFPTPEATYRLWKGRFDRWWEARGRPAHAWPDFYPGKRHWTAPRG
ncbi:MAG: hypothetical protein QOI63_1501 [Thermoplasmata archaeon]|jgi:hypothetical protein|nr:hypothetical protein [Thermoplasmata archaeon]